MVIEFGLNIFSLISEIMLALYRRILQNDNNDFVVPSSGTHYATSRKVAGSIPDEVTGFYK
jgi:hypothetical protein